MITKYPSDDKNVMQCVRERTKIGYPWLSMAKRLTNAAADDILYL